MQIRAILRFRNEDLTRRRLMAGFKTQKELAGFLGKHPTKISEWETFKNYPKNEKSIKALECALNCKICEIFPPEFIKAIDKKLGTPLEKVIDVKQLPGYTKGELLLPSPEEAYELKEKADLVKEALKMLTERESDVLISRFGLFENEGRKETLEEIGYRYRLTRTRIQQIEAKAIRKIKSSSIANKMRSLLNI